MDTVTMLTVKVAVSALFISSIRLLRPLVISVECSWNRVWDFTGLCCEPGSTRIFTSVTKKFCLVQPIILKIKLGLIIRLQTKPSCNLILGSVNCEVWIYTPCSILGRHGFTDTLDTLRVSTRILFQVPPHKLSCGYRAPSVSECIRVSV